MIDDNDNILNELDDIHSEGYKLESILAEYKGQAYMSGDKKTPKDILDEKTALIIKEADVFSASEDIASPPEVETAKPSAETGGAAPKPDLRDEFSSEIKHITGLELEPEVEHEPESGFEAEPEPDAKRGHIPETEPEPWFNPFAEPQEARKSVKQGTHQTRYTLEADKEVISFESYRKPQPDPQDTIVQDVERAIERELGYADQPNTANNEILGVFGDTEAGGPEFGYEEDFDEFEDEVYQEPDLRTAAKSFAEEANSISLRSLPAALITITMVILTFAYDAGMIIPFGIGRAQPAAVGMLIIGLLIVMILCSDIILRGALDLARGAPNAETLILFSCAFSVVSGVFTLLRGSPPVLTYCAVSALSLTFAAFGEKYNLRAITDTLKTSIGSSEPYGVLADYYGEIDKSILKKASNRNDGFYNNLIRPDISETLYRYAAPILLAAALLLSIITVIARGHGEYFLHILSALLAAAAPFSALMAFSVPFIIVSKSIRKSGAAIAGWGGADEICFSDGACVTDDDIFPPGTVSFNGIKLYEGVAPEKAIRYTASLIIESGSGLSRIYSEVLKTLSMKVVTVTDFACHEGGVGGRLNGERVMTGSAAFMNLLGIRVPDDMNMKNAVYTAINDKLTAMFVINYVPSNSVQSALISILKWRIKLFFAVRDFNLTPLMLEQKFKVSLEDVEYTQARDSYNISDLNTGKEGRVAAVLIREGLGPFAEAVTGGRLLKSAALVSTVISIISAFFGVIIMFYILWSGAFVSARPGNLILFMISMFAAVLLICGYARCRK